MIPTRDLEYTLGGRIAQIDEVGRGPLSGPVCAAAVILPAVLPDDLAGIRDSKKVSEKNRTRLAARIHECCVVGIGLATVAEIDEHNILQATFLAMIRAVDQLSERPDMVLVDGRLVPPDLTIPGRALIDGDALSTGIAAASIVAKVHRDALMHDLANLYPEFGWTQNAGYGTRNHLAALRFHGHTPHHRQSFRGVKGTKPYVKPLF